MRAGLGTGKTQPVAARDAFEWIGMAGIYGIVAIAALVLIIPNFIKTKGKVINYVEEE